MAFDAENSILYRLINQSINHADKQYERDKRYQTKLKAFLCRHRRADLVVSEFASLVVGRGFVPRTGHTNDYQFIQVVQTVSLLSTWALG